MQEQYTTKPLPVLKTWSDQRNKLQVGVRNYTTTQHATRDMGHHDQRLDQRLQMCKQFAVCGEIDAGHYRSHITLVCFCILFSTRSALSGLPYSILCKNCHHWLVVSGSPFDPRAHYVLSNIYAIHDVSLL
jgi:hypothetical protein